MAARRASKAVLLALVLVAAAAPRAHGEPSHACGPCEPRAACGASLDATEPCGERLPDARSHREWAACKYEAEVTPA